LRQKMLAQLTPGQPCWRCGKGMFPDTQPLDLDHAPGRPGWAGFEGFAMVHRACNRGHRLPGGRSERRRKKLRSRW
jgi:hypothetical protein